MRKEYLDYGYAEEIGNIKKQIPPCYTLISWVDTKIRIFNTCVKSVLLYGCETWLVTKEIQRKIQTFVNRCLRYILRIWWPNIISNKDLWKVAEQEDINLEIKKKNLDGLVTH